MAQYAHDPALGVGLYLFKADFTVQFVFIKAFDAGFADGLRAAVLHGVHLFGFFFIDAAHIADLLDEVVTSGVMAHKLRLDINAGQTELIHGQQGNLLFGQFVKQC